MWRPWGSEKPDYKKKIERLQEASKYGFLHLQDVVVQEKTHLPPFIIPKHDYHLPKSVDSISESYLHKYNVKEFGVPYAVSDNGSCLFNSVSLALCGSQDIAKELRVRTCIEMVIKKNRFTTLPISSDLLWVSPNYISSVIECAQECGWSFHATAKRRRKSHNCHVDAYFLH
ncbi:unnamed protein product [Mytilus edulis]|uniref:OTU domain-containing protein n=1 Tax=Mytilus edulis TaxID=6550 RepID=A0A8S3U0Q2_MYTED|nr:unnamed protein product [Mytilus edulis]